MDLISLIGALAFGSVVGWCSSLAVAKESRFGIAQLGALIGVTAGAAVTAKFPESMLFGGYCIGLAIAFFTHRFVSIPSVRKSINNSVKD